jgi:hypothetical protein
MCTIHLKEQIRQSLHSQMSTFSKDHPKIAAVVNEELLIDAAAKEIAEDPAYLRTMIAAKSAAHEAEEVLDLVQRLVTRFLWGLVL